MSAPPDPSGDRSDSCEPTDPKFLAEFQKAVEDLRRAGGEGNVEQEEALGMRLLMLATEHAAMNPSPDDEWRERITAAEDDFDWAKSIALRREHLAWKQSDGPHLTRWKDLMDLSRLLWICGERTQAVATAEEAVRCARASDLSVPPVMTWTLAARYAAASGRLDDAGRMVDAAMAEAESAAHLEGGITGTITIPLRLCRARLALARGDLLLAQGQLDAIGPEIERYADSVLMAGRRSQHAEHAELSGRLHLARGESTAAIESFERALHHLQAVLQMPHISGSHFVRYSMAKTQLLMAVALESTQPEAADDLRRQAGEQFDLLHVPPAPPGLG